jgi:hypothetical protein
MGSAEQEPEGTGDHELSIRTRNFMQRYNI